MGEKKQKGEHEWPQNPPLREGQGEELRDVAGPGDDTVFVANDDKAKPGEAKKRSKRNPRSANDDTARTTDVDDDAQHSRVER